MLIRFFFLDASLPQAVLLMELQRFCAAVSAWAVFLTSEHG